MGLRECEYVQINNNNSNNTPSNMLAAAAVAVQQSGRKSTFSEYKLPSLQLDLLSSQQVDIENYNVFSIRLLTPVCVWEREKVRKKLCE